MSRPTEKSAGVCDSLAAWGVLLAAGGVPLLFLETAEPFGPVKELLLAMALFLALPRFMKGGVVWPRWLAGAALLMSLAPLLSPRVADVQFFTLARPALRVLLLLAAAGVLTEPRWRKVFFRVTAFAAACVSGLAIWQYYGDLNPSWHIRQGPMAWSYRAVWSTLGNPNYVAEYLVLALFPCLSLFGEERRSWRIVGLLVAVLSIFAIVLSFSRAGWVVLAAGTILYLFLVRRGGGFKLPPEAGFLLLLITVMGFAVFATDNPLNRGGGLTGRKNVVERVTRPTGSLRKRVIAWQITAAAVPTAPLLGHGAGSFSRDYLQLQADWLQQHPAENVFWDNFRQTHNDWLQDAYETGLVGFLAGVVFFFGLFGRALRHHARQPAAGTAAAATSIGCFLLFRAIAFPDHLPASIMLCLFLAATTCTPEPVKSITGPRRWLQFPVLMISAFIVLDALLNLAVDRACFVGARALRHEQLTLAASELEWAHAMRPDSRSRFLLGTLAAAHGAHSRAEWLYSSALHAGEDPNIWFNVGLARLGQGKVREAREAFEKSLEILPFHYPSVMPLARIYFQSGLYSNGIRILQSLVRWREAVYRNGDLYDQRLPELETDAEKAFVQEMVLKGLRPGPQRLPDGDVLLRFLRLRPRGVSLLADFNQHVPQPLTEGDFPGVWEITLNDLPEGMHQYYFQLDDGEKVPDYAGETVVVDGETISLLRIP